MKKTHVAVLPSPGMGHLIPLVEFAKRLVSLHNISLTFIIPTDGPPSKAQTFTLDSLPASIDHVFLPPVNLTDVHANVIIIIIIIIISGEDGKKVRYRMKDLKEAAANVLSHDGSSTKALA
ncbi:hypothetical protein SLA2020_512210 [Shorea laevis]